MTVINTPTRLIPAARRAVYGLRPLWWRGYWDLKVAGLENLPQAGPMILCGNHTSHLDASAILAALPRNLALRTSTAAALDVWGEKPIRLAIGQVLTNCLPVGRNADFAKGLRSLDQVLAEGRPLILFPEGKRAPDGELDELKPGAAMLAARNNCPIIPVKLEGLYESLPRGDRFPQPHPVKVTFAKPIKPADFQEFCTGKRELYAAMTGALRKALS